MGDRYYIRATASLIDSDTGEASSVTAWAREAESRKGMDEAQVTGSSSSYARKYALNGLLAIDDTRDADTMDNRASGQAANKLSDGRSVSGNVATQAGAKNVSQALKTAQDAAKAARAAYITKTNSDPADVDAALQTVKGATWYTVDGCKIIFDTIAYWQQNGK